MHETLRLSHSNSKSHETLKVDTAAVIGLEPRPGARVTVGSLGACGRDIGSRTRDARAPRVTARRGPHDGEAASPPSACGLGAST